MSSTPQSVELLTVGIRAEQDIVACRQHAREFAELLGFDLQSQTRIATAVSEIARNAYQYARGGSARFFAETETSPERRFDLRRQSLVITIQDNGKGIDNLDEILAGNYRSLTGMGLGLIGARRLMDRVQVETGPAGSTVTLEKDLPPAAARKTVSQLRVLASRAFPQAADAVAEVQRQNHELLTLMEELRQRQADLGQLNKELEQTNVGVRALYDELETLHRVSLSLGSKINLASVLQVLVETTSDLAGACLAVCYMKSPFDMWEHHTDAGPQRDALKNLRSTQSCDFFGRNFGLDGPVHIPNLISESHPCCITEFCALLPPDASVKSCLAVPLVSPKGVVIGTLIYGASTPDCFTERSVRIVSSIAAQSVVAVEKAMLFDSVKATSEAKDKFVAMISHELRTPLTPVLSIISSLHQDESLGAETREDIAIVLRNILLEARLIDDLLEFQRIAKGNTTFELRPVDLHATVRNVLEMCRFDLSEKNHQEVLDLQADSSIILGDTARLQQILWNVLKNAIKFTPSGGSITISSTLEDSTTLCLSVSDTGRGIEATLLNGIFGAFEQGSVVGATEFGGLGLGLTIVKAFVEKHNGTVVAESPGRGCGSTIRMRFPLLMNGEVKAPEKKLRLPAPERMPPRVLLIDDHFDTLASLARLLGRRGYVVTTASSCVEALVHVGEASFDVILSDLGLPDGSGLELIETIRHSCATPAIALSGYGMEADLVQSKRAGFDTHLTKPIVIDELVVAIEDLLASFVCESPCLGVVV